MSILQRTQFGDPILRKKAKRVEPYKRAIINPRIIQYSRSTVLAMKGA